VERSLDEEEFGLVMDGVVGLKPSSDSDVSKDFLGGFFPNQWPWCDVGPNVGG
jgi:hypothetical protein